MTLLSLFDWIEHSSVGEAMHAGAWQFPMVEILHIAGFILAFGSIFIVNIRALGIALTQVPIASVAEDLRKWTRAGLAAQFVTGPLLLTAEATRFYSNTPFRLKAALLVIAIIFQTTIHRRTVLHPEAPTRKATAIVAGVSLALWVGVVVSGLSIVLFG